MADTRISALPAVAVPAAGDEFACNQAGVTKKETKTQITAATDANLAAHIAAAVLDHPNDSVTDVKLRNSAARSVIGRAAAAGGDPADIVAGADNQVLARTGGTLAFQAIVPAMVTDRTRRFFVPVISGLNVTDFTDLIVTIDQGLRFPDAKRCRGHGMFMVPDDFVSGMTATAVVIPNANGNIWSRNQAKFGACNESYALTVDIVGYAAVAVAGATTRNNCIQPISLTGEAAGDIVHLDFDRTATNPADTVNDFVYFSGWIVSYTADS